MNHIRVTLEFIPVEKRLPEFNQTVFGLWEGIEGISQMYYSDDRECWHFSNFNETVIETPPTHWAIDPTVEIPEIAKEGE